MDLGLQMTGSERGTAVEKLRRWQVSGGLWRVMSRTSSGLTVARLACDADEEVDTLTFEDAENVGLHRWPLHQRRFTPRVSRAGVPLLTRDRIV